MKRTGNLFVRIVARDNLRLAFHNALRDKRDRRDAQQFARKLDQNLEEMAEQVAAGTYHLGRYQQFIIHDPKERIMANRNRNAPTNRNNNLGFRLARVPRGQRKFTGRNGRSPVPPAFLSWQTKGPCVTRR